MRLFSRVVPFQVILAVALSCSGSSGGATDVSTADVPIADSGEDAGTGEVDAGCVCGNGACEAACGESLQTCPCDCKVCEDGLCSPCEGPLSAKTDCCGTCGDGLCMGFDCGENPSTCAADCGAKCGSGTCDKGENPYACPEDCKWQICGNGVCEPSDGGFAQCPDDCGPDCGDCTCGPSENWMQCPIDCGFCGDHVCSDCPLLLEGADGACAKDCSTANCTPESYKSCCGKDVCWFDACDNAGAVFEACPEGCANGACVAAVDMKMKFAATLDDVNKDLSIGDVVIANIVLGFSGTKDLVVVVTRDEKPAPDEQVTFVQSGGAPQIVTLLAGTVATDSTGTARATVQAAGQTPGWTQFKACVGGQPGVECVLFNVYVAPQGHVPLAVAVPSYEGSFMTSSLSQVYVRVFRQDAIAPAPAQCGNLLPELDATAPLTTGVVDRLTGTVFFDHLPDLGADGTFALTVVADLVFGQIGVPGVGFARGCIDSGVQVTGAGPTTYLEVPVADIQAIASAPLYWTMTNSIDLYTGLPASVKQAVDDRVAFLVDPAAQTLMQFCRIEDGQGVLPKFCNRLFTDPANPNPGALTAEGTAVLSVLSANTSAALQASCPLANKVECASVWFKPEEIQQFLMSVRQTGSLWMNELPGSDGVLPKGAVELWFDNAIVQWPFGLSCPAGDDSCGWFPVSLTAFPLWAGIGHMVTQGKIKENGQFLIDSTAWMPGLGSVLSGLLEWMGTRLVGGKLTDGWAHVLETVMGGVGCANGEGCCTMFGVLVEAANPKLLASEAAFACSMLLEMGPDALRLPIVELDLDPTASSLVLPGCPLHDTDGDRTWDALGSKASPCAWNATIPSTVGTFTPAFTIFAVTDH